jgi:THO complex subunit 7
MSIVSASEDDLIKKRLLIEGDSGNDDRLINKLVKNFVKWTNSFYNVNGTNGQMKNGDQNCAPLPLDEENSAEFLYEQIAAALAHIEFGLVRNQFILDMNKVEQENYDLLYKKINNEIEKAKKKIVENKFELQEARKFRKNRQEYDILARQILNYPDRIEMQNTIKALEGKMESLKKSETELDKKIDLRRKQFGVVLQSLSSLKNLIETDTNLDHFLNATQTEESSQNHEQETMSSEIVSSELVVSQKTDTIDTNSESAFELKPKFNAEDADDTEDETLLTGSDGKREKHQTVAEVEMEEI